MVVCQASRISSSSSMLRQTWARSGRCRTWSAVALRTTSQPSRSPAATASSSVGHRDALPQLTPYAASSSLSSSSSSGRPSGAPTRAPVTTARARAWSASRRAGDLGVGPRQPGGVLHRPGQRPHRRVGRLVRRHRPAARGAAGGVGHAQQLGHALGGQEGRQHRLVGLLPHHREHVGDLGAAGVDRRDEHRQHRVDVGVVESGVERGLEVLRVGLGARARRPAGPRGRPRRRRRRPSAPGRRSC